MRGHWISPTPKWLIRQKAFCPWQWSTGKKPRHYKTIILIQRSKWLLDEYTNRSWIGEIFSIRGRWVWNRMRWLARQSAQHKEILFLEEVDLAELLQITNKSTASHGSGHPQMLRTLPSHHHRPQLPCAFDILVLSSPSWYWPQLFW